MKNTEQHTNINLDELFAGARSEEPVINIDEARSILHTKAGQPHAFRPARESIFSQPLKLFAIMTPAIGLLCLGLYLYLGKPMEQKHFSTTQQISETLPHSAAKSVSDYNENKGSTSPLVTDTLKNKSRIINTNDRLDINNEDFKLITIKQDSVADLKDRNVLKRLEKISVFREGNQFDTIISSLHNGYLLHERDREKVISQWDNYTDTMAVNIRAQMKFRDSLLRNGARFCEAMSAKSFRHFDKNPAWENIKFNKDPARVTVQIDSFMKAVHPELIHPELGNQYSVYINIAPFFIGSDKDIREKLLLYKYKGKGEYKYKNKEVKNQAMQVRVYLNQDQLNYRNLLKDSSRKNVVPDLSNYKVKNMNLISSSEFHNDSQKVRVYTFTPDEDLKRKTISNEYLSANENKLNSVPFLELDNETLNKLGIVYNDYKVFYHGEINKLGGTWKSAITLTMSPCFPPCDKRPDTALTSNYAMKSRLKSTKRDFFPVFTSDRTGTDFKPVKFEREKLTNRADFLKQANSLVPVIVKTNRKTFNMEDVVFWFAPTDEFFKILPDSIGKELSIEYKKLNRNPDGSTEASSEKNPFKQNKQLNNNGTGENCKYFEVCRTNSGAITNTLIYPNPASTQFNLVLGLQGSRNIKISLLDIQGKLIKELAPSALKTDGRHNYSFHLDDINRGVYLVLIESDQNEQSIQRLVVDK